MIGSYSRLLFELAILTATPRRTPLSHSRPATGEVCHAEFSARFIRASMFAGILPREILVPFLCVIIVSFFCFLLVLNGAEENHNGAALFWRVFRAGRAKRHPFSEL